MCRQDVAAYKVAPFSFRGTVLTAVEFDDQAKLETGEIGEIAGHRMLSPEPQAAQAPCAQVIPDADLGVGLTLSQEASKGSLVVRETHASSMRSVAGMFSTLIWESDEEQNPEPSAYRL